MTLRAQPFNLSTLTGIQSAISAAEESSGSPRMVIQLLPGVVDFGQLSLVMKAFRAQPAITLRGAPDGSTTFRTNTATLQGSCSEAPGGYAMLQICNLGQANNAGPGVGELPTVIENINFESPDPNFLEAGDPINKGIYVRRWGLALTDPSGPAIIRRCQW